MWCTEHSFFCKLALLDFNWQSFYNSEDQQIRCLPSAPLPASLRRWIHSVESQRPRWVRFVLFCYLCCGLDGWSFGKKPKHDFIQRRWQVIPRCSDVLAAAREMGSLPCQQQPEEPPPPWPPWTGGKDMCPKVVFVVICLFSEDAKLGGSSER